MEKKRPDDIRFLINTFAITLTVVALLVAFQPYLENEPRLEEVQHIEREIVTIKPEQLAEMVKPKDNKPVLLMAYASWCVYCRQVMPVVVKAVRNHELDGFRAVFVSMDEQPRKLSKYLVHNDYHTVFSPYAIDHGLLRRISTAMQPSGSSFTGVIPYIGFFDRHGKVRAEYTGVVSKDRLMEMAKSVNE